MDKNCYVEDEEELYRSIRGRLDYDEYYYDNQGNLIFNYKAFSDRNFKPSVDRAKLRDNPALSRLSETDGIVSLTAGDIRTSKKVKTKVNENEVVLDLEVVYDPTPENPAHSIIDANYEVCASITQKRRAFDLLKMLLAELATEKGWTLEPRLE